MQFSPQFLATKLVLKSTNKVSPIRGITTTPSLNAEPLKKRARMDPALLKIRVERKIKRCEREIEKLEKEPRQPIPILEYQNTSSVTRDLQARSGRTLEEVGLDKGILRSAHRMWGFYRGIQSRMERRSIRQVEQAQNRALETLKELDEQLYERTVSVDEVTLVPYLSSHIRKETPANPNYVPPDGRITDITKEWVM